MFKQQNAVLTLPIQLSSYASQYTLDNNITACEARYNTRSMAAAAATQRNHHVDDHGDDQPDTQEVCTVQEVASL